MTCGTLVGGLAGALAGAAGGSVSPGARCVILMSMGFTLVVGPALKPVPPIQFDKRRAKASSGMGLLLGQPQTALCSVWESRVVLASGSSISSRPEVLLSLLLCLEP